MLLPFVGKAFHIDDPLFLWTAEQVSVDPADFFGFDVNWYGVVEPIWAVTKNPPLASYYIALVAAVGGWSEISLHLGMILPALALALGIHQLALHLCREARLAALIALATPAFLVSATSLMSDVSMLALWVWAIAIFMRGLEGQRTRDFVLAGVLMGLCALTKYFGLALIPLLIAYASRRERRAGPWLWSIAVACVMVGAYDLYTRGLYGFDPLLDMMGYANEPDIVATPPFLRQSAIGLFFLGGCTLGSILWIPFVWPRRALTIVVSCIAVLALGVAYLFAQASWGLDIELQEFLFAAAGIHVLFLAGADCHARRDPESVLLLLWVLGVFVFAAFTNWTANGRSILPVIPALGILIARAVERRGGLCTRIQLPIVAVGFAIAGVVAVADAQLAGSARTAARRLSAPLERAGARLYFQGSWGFQRYMELAGVERLKIGESRLRLGDRIVMAGNNSNVYRLPRGYAHLIEVEEVPKSGWIAIMSRLRSAGYHASVWGPLPFSFGDPGPEEYRVFVILKEWAPEPYYRSKSTEPGAVEGREG